MNSKECSRCKNQVNANDKFCPHCGAPVVADTLNERATIHCPKCNHENPQGAAFCEKCGTSLTESGPAKKEQSSTKTFSSAGNYSGKMTKGKTSRGWKRMRTAIIVIIIALVVAIAVWFAVDPDAGEKLKNIAGGLLVAAIFIFFVLRGNRKKRKSRDDYDYYENDDDLDNDD